MYLFDFKRKEEDLTYFPTPSAIFQKNSLFSMGSFCFCSKFKNVSADKKRFVRFFMFYAVTVTLLHIEKSRENV